MHSRRLRTLALLLGTVAALGVAAGAYQLSRLAPIGTAYAAKMLCSGVFVSRRLPEDVEREDIRAENHPLLGLVQTELDTGRQRISATFVGFAQRVAQYRPGAGCTLALGADADALIARLKALGPARPARALPTAAPPPEVDGGALATTLDWAFSEPDPEHLRRTRAVVILYDGKIIAERYAHGFSGDMPLPGWSMTKTITGALAGILVQEGKLRLESKALLPEWRGRNEGRAEITLNDLLRMTDGLAFSERYDDPLSDVMQMLLVVPDVSRYATAKPLQRPPGTSWRYASGTSNALMAVLCVAHGGTKAEFAQWIRDTLFDRIGMSTATFETDPSGMPVASSFLYASARDWARFGQFLLQEGRWDGAQILPLGWVHYMATVTPLAPRRDFGAHVWVRVSEPYNSADPVAPALPADTFHAIGHEGQLLSVIPSKRLVVVRLGLSRRRGSWDHEAFLGRVLAAFPG